MTHRLEVGWRSLAQGRNKRSETHLPRILIRLRLQFTAHHLVHLVLLSPFCTQWGHISEVAYGPGRRNVWQGLWHPDRSPTARLTLRKQLRATSVSLKFTGMSGSKTKENKTD